MLRAALAVFSLAFGPALAVGAPAAAKPADPCLADAKRLCGKAEARENRYAACLSTRLSQVSTDCLASHPEWGAALPPNPPASHAEPPKPVPTAAPTPAQPPAKTNALSSDDWTALSAGWKEACGAGLSAVCPDGSGERRLWSCVETRWDALTQKCRDFARGHDAWKRHCPAEISRFCAQSGPRDTGRCLKAHAKELTGRCKAFALPAPKKPR